MLINNNIYFVHIPRTGGRFITDLFKINKHHVRLDSFIFWKGQEVPHLTYPHYEIFLNFLECQKFTIVRNPVDRFVSAINDYYILNEKTIEKMFMNQETFNMYINNYIVNENNGNWFVPQINFLNYDVKIYRFEDGFEENLFKWIFDNLNIKINTTMMNNYNSKIKNIDLTNKQKQFVENYYYKDFKILNY